MADSQRHSPNTRSKVNPYRELCYAVLLSAYRDVVNKTAHEATYRRRACWFFDGGDYVKWAELAEIEPEVAYKGYLRVKKDGKLPKRGDNG